MFVQWCIKGIRGQLPHDPPGTGIDDDEAKDIIRAGNGIQCNWWRAVKQISPAELRKKLTTGNLNRHVHDYAKYGPETPFISLTAGCVERDMALRLNRVHEAEDIALRFATRWGRRHGYLYLCWVVVGLKPAVGVEGVAEEVRDLNSGHSYSDYQLEGEVTAKIIVPANQIHSCARWDASPVGMKRSWSFSNPKFDGPSLISNIRDLL